MTYTTHLIFTFY